MGLNTEERLKVIYFTGYEVEHTVCYGMLTLFVVGTPPLEEILSEAKLHRVQQIYFGTSQSFCPVNEKDWQEWNDVITGCLKEKFWVTLDFDVKYASDESFIESVWFDYEKFVPMISVKLPYIKNYNFNTTIKIDDKTWGFSNPGVWTHHLNELMNLESYTHWDQYQDDSLI